MKRRRFLQTAAGACAAGLLRARRATAAIPPMKITRIRYYFNPNGRPLFNQSANVVTIETDAGVTGVGEGGAKDTVEQCAAMLIGEDPSRTDHLWQMMERGYFYPAGREKLDALGALDLALWDIKAKALGVPLYQMFGGLARNHIECYSTGFPDKGTIGETAKACIAAGFRAFRYATADAPEGGAFNSHEMVRKTAGKCREIREAIGNEADWAIDFHTRFDMPDAIRLATLLEDLEPYFCEDLVRSENPGIYRQLRPQVKVPIAVGEQFGYKWDVNELIENHLIDYARVTLPNVGGFTELLKISALCETHYVGLIPHFTGPISEAALVHACAVFSGPVLMEMTGDGTRLHQPHLPECYDFRDGKMFPNQRPGLGVTLDTKPLRLQSEITTRFRLTPIYERPDGSITNW